MKTGLFFGSFNPVHIGHLILANSMLEQANLDEVWFVISPQNPFKKKGNLLHEHDRLHMVRLAIADNSRFRASDIEFRMPQPSYTADTLAYLSDKHPTRQFFLIIGEDNLPNFPKWKNSEFMLENYGLLVYPRKGAKASPLPEHPNVQLVEAPEVDISATFIRKAIQKGKSIQYLVHQDVEVYIKSKKFYE